MMPKLEVKQLRRMVWSFVSNAALRSESEKKSGEPIISCMLDRIKEVNERDVSRVMSAMIETRLAGNIIVLEKAFPSWRCYLD